MLKLIRHNMYNNMKNRKWVVFGNAKRCNHTKSLHEQWFISWVQRQEGAKFQIGDIVYLFVSDERRVRFKLVVVAENQPRQDGGYWIETPPNDVTYKLELLEEYNGEKLNEEQLLKNGFKGGGSLQQPCCNNKQLLDYISICM